MQGNFYTDVIKHDQRFHSVHEVHDIMLLEPITRAKVQAMIAEAETMGVQLMAWETYRSTELQAIYYEHHVTKLKNVGVHHFGLACDIVRKINGQPSWKGDFKFLLPLARKHQLISGWDWGHPEVHHDFVDVVHVQRCSIAMQSKLFAGTFYPDVNYDPYKA